MMVYMDNLNGKNLVNSFVIDELGLASSHLA